MLARVQRRSEARHRAVSRDQSCPVDQVCWGAPLRGQRVCDLKTGTLGGTLLRSCGCTTTDHRPRLGEQDRLLNAAMEETFEFALNCREVIRVPRYPGHERVPSLFQEHQPGKIFEQRNQCRQIEHRRIL